LRKDVQHGIIIPIYCSFLKDCDFRILLWKISYFDRSRDFNGDFDFFDLHEKSLYLSNYVILPHKILKSRSSKKSSIGILIAKSLLKIVVTQTKKCLSKIQLGFQTTLNLKRI